LFTSENPLGFFCNPFVPPASLGVSSSVIALTWIITEAHWVPRLLDRPRRKISLSFKVHGDAFRLSLSSRAERPRLT